MRAILSWRALYSEVSIADLYDELTMPKELRKAHQENNTSNGSLWLLLEENDWIWLCTKVRRLMKI